MLTFTRSPKTQSGHHDHSIFGEFKYVFNTNSFCYHYIQVTIYNLCQLVTHCDDSDKQMSLFCHQVGEI